MDLIEIMGEIPLPHPCDAKYKGIAFDGCHYYLTCLDYCELVKYDLHFCEVEVIKTSRAYSCICFDHERNCFWAGSLKCPHKIFKIDHCLREIDSISLSYCESFSGVMTGISYDCIKNGLLVCYTNSTLFVCPEMPKEYELLQTSCYAWNLAVVSVAPSYLVVEAQSTKQVVCIYDGDTKLQRKYEIPCGYVAEALLFSPCTMGCHKLPRFYLLAAKNGCYPYLLEFVLPNCPIDICNCNHAICHSCCKPCPKPKDVCADLMESIALMETALSHILNAEGEKLQKTIATTDDIDKILCVNQSIQDTIVRVTHLEVILHDKLAAIKACCHICKEDD